MESTKLDCDIKTNEPSVVLNAIIGIVLLGVTLGKLKPKQDQTTSRLNIRNIDIL